MADIILNNNIGEDIIKIYNDIKDIDDILNDVYKAILTLDESKWQAREKNKLDQELIPYLSKISKSVRKNMLNNLNFLKDAVESHKNVDMLNTKRVETDII